MRAYIYFNTENSPTHINEVTDELSKVKSTRNNRKTKTVMTKTFTGCLNMVGIAYRQCLFTFCLCVS